MSILFKEPSRRRKFWLSARGTRARLTTKTDLRCDNSYSNTTLLPRSCLHAYSHLEWWPLNNQRGSQAFLMHIFYTCVSVYFVENCMKWTPGYSENVASAIMKNWKNGSRCPKTCPRGKVPITDTPPEFVSPVFRVSTQMECNTIINKLCRCYWSFTPTVSWDSDKLVLCRTFHTTHEQKKALGKICYLPNYTKLYFKLQISLKIETKSRSSLTRRSTVYWRERTQFTCAWTPPSQRHLCRPESSRFW